MEAVRDESVEAPRRDIVVIGASAGGVEALSSIATDLPSDLHAAVFVAIHLPPGGRSFLSGILDRAGPLPAAAAVDGAAIVPGSISVAPPDHHLLLERDRVRVLRRAKVNGFRPSVDVLFHSAARAHGGNVVGVVLSGTLTDGTLGLRAIKRRAGVAIVQADALHQGMPTSAMENVDVDLALPLREIARELTMLSSGDEEATTSHDGPEDEETIQSDLESGFDVSEVHEAPGGPTILRCPECGGALWELEDGVFSGFACHVGHTYSADSLLDEQDGAVERAVWSAVRLLEERAVLVGKLAERMERGGSVRSRRRFEEKARLAEEQAALIRRTLLEPSENGPGDEDDRA